LLKYSWTFTFKKILTNTYISQKPRQGNCAKKLNAMHFFKMLFLSTVFSLKILYLKVLRSNSKLIILWKVKLCFYLAVAITFSEFQSIIYGPVTSLFEGEWDHCVLQIHRMNSGCCRWWRKLSHHYYQEWTFYQ